MFWWPRLGAGRDLDLLLGAFRGLTAGAWLAARAPRLAEAGLIVLSAVHVVFWSSMTSAALDRLWVP